MYPILFSYGPIIIPAWHFMYALGACAGFGLFMWLVSQTVPNVTTPQITRIFAICYVSGYFGARLMSIMIEEPEVVGFDQTMSALTRFGAMTFYGGALSAAILGSLYVWNQSMPLARLFDCGIPAGLLALCIGRIGCFLNGDDFGKAVLISPGDRAPFWSVTFPNLSDGVARYPVQLLESAFAFVLCLVLVFTLKRRYNDLRAGYIGLTGALGYAFARFLLEFLRDDFRGVVPGTGLSTSQGISLMVGLYCLLQLRHRPQGRANEVTAIRS